METSNANGARPAAEGILQPAGALETTERLARVGTLVAVAAHEINNPITYLLANLEDLQQLVRAARDALARYRQLAAHARDAGALDAAQDAEAKLRDAGGLELGEELVGDALEGALRIRNVVRDLLSLGRGQPCAGAATELVDVNEILNSALRLMGRELGGAAAVEADLRARTRVEGSRARLGQVILNLLANARDACQPPDPTRHRVRVRSRDEGDRVRIEVEDTGPGIPTELRGRIFAPFFTTKDPGTGSGLGLYVSRWLVHEHGGALEFRDGPDRGTIFSVTLPVAEATAAESD